MDLEPDHIEACVPDHIEACEFGAMRLEPGIRSNHLDLNPD